MNNKFFKICMLAAIAMAANACDTGEYNNLDCDNEYVSECLTTDAYMFCNGNKLEVAYCSNGQICVQTDAGHQCAPAIEDGCTSSSCNGNVLKQCNNGISTDIDCSLTGQICNPSTFACETPTEKCTASSCAPDGVTLNQCDTLSGQITPLNCSNSNQVCGTDESGNAACVDAEAETCTETVCDADTNILKVCNIPEGETEGTVEEKNCADDNMICGTDNDGNPACVDATPEACTADACSEDGNILKHCKMEDGAEEGIVEEEDCTKDADGNDTGLVCGLDADGNPACVEPAPETCTASACSEDGLILNFCKIEGDATEGVIEAQDCTKDADGNDTDKVCGLDADGNAACVDKCVAEDTKCEEGTLYVCNEETGVLAITACADDSKVCGEDADGKPACVAETCTADACSEDGSILKHCIIPEGAEEGAFEAEDCTKDAEGNSTGMVCGLDADEKPACIAAETPVECDATYVAACAEDGKTLNVCNIPDGADKGTVEAKDCSADSDMICGLNTDGVADCIAKCVAADTKCDETTLTLTVCDETTGVLTTTVCSTDNKICGVDDSGAPACVEAAANTCTANVCDEDGKLVVCTIAEGETIGTPEEPQACTDNKVCGLDGEVYACIDPCTSEANVCDGEVLKQCNETTGLVEDVNCAESTKICDLDDQGAAACIDACIASEPVCNDDATAYLVCGEDGHMTETACLETEVCSEGACIEKCTVDDNACSEDGLSLTTCDETTGIATTEACGTGKYCGLDSDGKPACVDAESVVGMPCTCEGEDCDVIITGAEFKAIFNDSVASNEIMAPMLAKIADTDNVTGPNFYATGNKGCEDLAAAVPAGMTAACYRQGEVVVPDSILNFLGTDLPSFLLDPAGDGSVEPADSDKKVAAALKSVVDDILAQKVEFKSPAGYCMPVALDASMVTEGVGSILLKEDAFASDGPLAGKFNTGSHDTAKTATCPTGSSLYVYELQKKFNYVGNNILNFDLCLQTCDPEASKCRDGFDCMQLQEVGLQNYSKDERPYVCFSNEAHQYFIDLKAKLAAIKAML